MDSQEKHGHLSQRAFATTGADEARNPVTTEQLGERKASSLAFPSQAVRSLQTGATKRPEKDGDHVFQVPTETVEGYAVKLNDIEGIKELMLKKDRDFNSGKVFTLVPEKPTDIKNYALVSDLAQKLIDQYIPGEITLILPKNPAFHHFYYDHFNTIGIRIPNYQPFLKILAKTGPLLLTSANPRGGTPKSITGHLPSTIVDLTKDHPCILRQGNLKINLDDYIY